MTGTKCEQQMPQGMWPGELAISQEVAKQTAVFEKIGLFTYSYFSQIIQQIAPSDVIMFAESNGWAPTDHNRFLMEHEKPYTGQLIIPGEADCGYDYMTAIINAADKIAAQKGDTVWGVLVAIAYGAQPSDMAWADLIHLDFTDKGRTFRLRNHVSLQKRLIPLFAKSSPFAASVYLALMAIISATGRTNVKAARVAKLAGCSVSSVRWTVRAMEKDGIITVTRKQGNRGNRYFLNSQE